MARLLPSILGAAVLCASTVSADEILIPDLKWSALDVGEFGPAQFVPSEQPNPHDQNTETFWQFELGRLAFRSPAILGGLAAREGMSCNSCHLSGGNNAFFFVDGLSSERGTFDTTNALFSTHTDDQIDNPVKIPTLFRVAETAPYPSDGRFETLTQMADHVIEKEFDGLRPPERVHTALIAYLSELNDPAKSDLMARSVSMEIGNLQRSLRVAGWTLRQQDIPATEFVVNSVRRDLELLYNRFIDLEDAQSIIEVWSLSLKNVRLLAEEHAFDQAQAALDEVGLKISQEASLLLQLETQSLYDAERLAAYIDTVFDR